MKLYRNNRSGVTGVCWHSASQKWMASIQRNSVQHYLGVFATVKEAKAAYDAAAKDLEGFENE